MFHPEYGGANSNNYVRSIQSLDGTTSVINNPGILNIKRPAVCRLESSAVASGSRPLAQIHAQGAAADIGRNNTLVVEAEVINTQLPGALDGMIPAVDEQL